MLLNAGNPVAPAAADLLAAQTRVDNDVEKVPLFLANTIQSEPANTPPSAEVLNQWNQMVSKLAADVSDEWQAFVHYEFAVLGAYQQAIAQTFATLLADLDGNLTGHGPASSSTTPVSGTASGSTASGQGQAASPLNDPLMSYAMTAPSLVQMSSQTLTPSLSHNQSQGGGSSGPLYVLDLDTGETIPANVTLNTFSTWKEDLLAQVSGGTVSSYSWNLTQAPDFGFVSGTNTANLQGTWAPNTGAKKDIISVTETPQVGQAETFTMTFEVAGTSSPAYSSSRPTSNNTWPTVITPDQLSSGQATQATGPYASIGEADGSLQTSFSMPSYNPNTTPVSVDYSSTTANAQPIFLDEYQLPMGQSVPSSITAQLTFKGTALSTVTYNTSGLNAGDIVQIALQANATGLTTGRYPWSITVTNGTNQTTSSGNVDIVNQSGSPYGAGWSLDNAEQFFPVTGGVILVNPDGTSLWFASNGQGGYTTPAGDFSTLAVSNGVYTRTMPDGTKINFNSSSGQQTSIVDRDGNTTTFGYTSGQLTTITDMNNQVTTLTYSSGLLSSITDPDSRTATLTYTGKQLTSITDPASDVWQYSYDSANDLTKLTDPNNHATSFTYNSADRVSSVTLADLSTEQLTAMQMNGWAAAGGSTNAVLLATGDQALFTDGNSNVWTTGINWLGFGSSVLNADPLGDTSLTYRDPNDLPWMSSDPLSRRIREFFNSQGNPTEIVNADDSYSQYQYNGFSEVTQYTDPTNDVSTYTYNSKGDMTQMEDALLHTWTYTYNSVGLVTSQEDPLLNTTSYGYNTLNELVSVTNALNQTVTYGYNTDGLVTSSTDALNYTSTYGYDAMNRLTGETLPDSSTTDSVYTYTYDKVGNETSATDPLNHVTGFTYNAVNELTNETNALTQTTTYTYDSVGNLIGITNPLNQTTTGTYNAANELVGVTNALDFTYTYTYDSAGEKITAENPLSQTSTYTYNSRGWLASVKDPLDNVTSYTYDAYGDQTVQTLTPSQGGGTLSATLTYNADHELTSYTDSMSQQTAIGYDADGNQISVTDPLSHTLSYTYNALNQLVGVTNAINQTTTYTYDADGNQTSVTNPLSQTTTYTYDAQGRVLTEKAPNGGVTTYTYDVAGNLLSLTDPDNNTTSYSYDAVNELVTMTNPQGHQTTYAYNAGGLLTSTTDADGRTITYGYNAIGQETSETWVGGNYTATYQYDKAGELTNASDPNSVYSYTYDADGRETSVSNSGTPNLPTVTLSYTYDALGDRTSLTDSLGGNISYGYNGDQQLTSLTLSINNGPGISVTFGYDAANRLTAQTRKTSQLGSDTISTSYTYDNANELTNITSTDTTKSVTLANYTYSYTKGELTGYQDNSGNSLTYGYDANDELTSATGTLNSSNYTLTYNYDLNGNRTSTSTDVNGSLTSATYSTGTGNEMTSDGTYSYTYDNVGNMTSQTNISTGYVTYYSWDYRNRLIEVKQEDNHGTVLNDEKFTYDVNNNRIAVSLNGTTQLYTVYDGANPYMDFNGSGTLTERYLTNPKALSQFYGQVNASGTRQWFLTDNINSIRQVISTSGSVLDAITYDPYGNIITQTSATNAPRSMFAGGAVDSITGNCQFGVRSYNTADGRFLTQDWEGFAAGDRNLYRYVFNQPTEMIDPSGLKPHPLEPRGDPRFSPQRPRGVVGTLGKYYPDVPTISQEELALGILSALPLGGPFRLAIRIIRMGLRGAQPPAGQNAPGVPRGVQSPAGQNVPGLPRGPGTGAAPPASLPPAGAAGAGPGPGGGAVAGPFQPPPGMIVQEAPLPDYPTKPWPWPPNGQGPINAKPVGGDGFNTPRPPQRPKPWKPPNRLPPGPSAN